MPSTRTTLSSSSASKFQLILDNALRDYTKQTGVDLAKYDFVNKLETCRSPDEVILLLREKARKFKEYREGNRKLINWVTPIVQVVHVFSGFLGEASSMHSFSPGKAIFAGVDVLLTAAMSVSSSYDALVDLFESVGNFLKRLNIYAEIPLTDEMMEMLVKIMVEVLSVLALATKEIKQGRLKKFAKVLFKGGGEIEAVLQRLDRLTMDEARLTVTQTLKVVYGLVNNVKLVMDNGVASMDSIREALVSMQGTASEVNKIRRDQLQAKVRNWLLPPDPSTNQNLIYEAYQQGTASWFFQGNVFAEWKATGPLLWIHGKPGSGKSTLISSIIHDLDRKRAAGLASVVYYYFDFREADKQTRPGLLSSLLIQLAAESDPCCDILSRLYTTHAGGARKPNDAALTQCLKEMFEHHRQATYIVIDGIDECPNTSGFPTAREKVLGFLEELLDLQGLQLPHLRICVASRPELDIRETLEPLTTLRVSLHEEVGQRKDILDYVTKVVHTDKRMRKWRKEDKELVIEIISEQSDGMFRWAFCQLESLRLCFPASIRSAILALPKNLDETYEQILLNIDAEKREYAQRLFQCLTLSIRPLRVNELAEILAIRFDDSGSTPNYNASWRSRDAEEAVLSACSGLITVANIDGSRVVQFSHFSVKEFLTSERLATMGEELSRYHILPGPAHIIMAKACLSILLKLDDSVDIKTIENSPLSLYAARHWIEHAHLGDASSIQDVMFRLFDPDKPHFRAWIWLYDMDRQWGNHMSTPHPAPPRASPLYYAAFCGFYDLVEKLVRTHPTDINAKGGYHITPLHASLRRGHRQISQLLLREGASVDVLDNEGSTALHRACRAGNLELVQLLLKHNADVHSQTRKQERPLHLAAADGGVEICRLLIERGADINSRDNLEWTPLHSGSRYGHVEVVEMLLDRGADLDTKKKDDWTSLHLASANGKFDVVQLLIQRGAIVGVRNDCHETPLDRAAANGHLNIAQLLLKSGADVNAIDKHSWTPLHTASRNGYREIVQLLLGSGADLHVRTGSQKTPLSLACSNGRLEIARCLIERGSNLNARDQDGWTPIHSAARYGYVEVARLLLDSGADMNVLKADGWTPMHLASANGQLGIVQLLVERGANVDSRNDKEETALDRAAANGYLNIVRFLTKNGAALSARDDKGWTPFHSASKCGHLHIAKYLLGCGIAVDVRNGSQETSLDLASGSGKIDVVRFLIEHGADIHAKDSKGWNPLHIAAQSGHLDVVRMLVNAGTAVDIRTGTQKTPLALASTKGRVEVGRFLIRRGADMNAQDNESWIPLHFAARRGHCEIVRLLLDRGVPVNVQKDDLWSPLHLAASSGHVKVAQLLIQRDARIDILNDQQETPLDRAAANGKADVVRFLIAHGAKINITDCGGWTPLHSASRGGHLDVVKLLLGHGADVEALTKTKQTAEDVASEKNKSEVANFLAEYRSDENVRKEIHLAPLDPAQIVAEEKAKKEEKSRKTTLHTAAEEGKIDIVRSFLDKGEDVNSENAYNKTALDLAAAKGKVDVVRLLIERGARVDSRDKQGWTPLHKASRYGQLQVAQELIINGANMNARKQDDWTPLHLSARNGHLGVVKLLLERGADVCLLNDEARTAQQLAVGKGHLRIADLLREHDERGERAGYVMGIAPYEGSSFQ